MAMCRLSISDDSVSNDGNAQAAARAPPAPRGDLISDDYISDRYASDDEITDDRIRNLCDDCNSADGVRNTSISDD
jgi:hypothetical protein